jgi:lipocalin
MFVLNRRIAQLALFSYFAFPVCKCNAQECKTVETKPDFDLEVYASTPWFSQQQAENRYSPLERNYCVRAEYRIRRRDTFWGYTVDVINTAEDKDGNEFGGDLCAYQMGDSGSEQSKLAVAPCFLPTQFSGPYWVVAYDEAEGYALISGGQPTIFAEGGIEFGCKSGSGINNSGLWIFTRSQLRDHDLVNKVRGIAADAGFDLSVLNDVDQSVCGATARPTTKPVTLEPTVSPTSSQPTIPPTSQPTSKPIESEPTSNSPTMAPSSPPVKVPTKAPTGTPTEKPCADTDEPFSVWFGARERDCDWVDSDYQFFRELRCMSHADKCPETCGRCE